MLKSFCFCVLHVFVSGFTSEVPVLKLYSSIYVHKYTETPNAVIFFSWIPDTGSINANRIDFAAESEKNI